MAHLCEKQSVGSSSLLAEAKIQANLYEHDYKLYPVFNQYTHCRYVYVELNVVREVCLL